MRILLKSVCTLLIAAPLLCAANNVPVLSQTKEYSVLLSRLEKGDKDVSFKQVYTKGKAVAASLLGTMQSMKENEYKKAESQMQGFHISREEALFVEPDMKFFGKLAKKYGNKTDSAYFTLAEKIKPDGAFSSYIQQQTDVSGCTAYGNGLMIHLYKDIADFRSKFPTAYKEEIQAFSDDLEQQFTSESVCACGDAQSVITDLNGFLQTFPKAPIVPQVQRTLNDVKARKASVRFNCQSG
jgi:hypothetical protein